MTRKVLIVDDEEPILTLLSTILGSVPEYSILRARNGKEALRSARAEHPALILLDNKLPLISGFEVCGLVKSDPAMSGTRVLMLSCQGQNFDWQKAREMGADGYITKPFDTTVLMEKVAELTK